MHKQSITSLFYSSNTPTNNITINNNTLKDQLEQLESSLHHHQKLMETQKKTHNELYLQIRHLEQRAAHAHAETMQQIDERVHSTLMAMAQLDKQHSKECDSLDIQKQELQDGQRGIGVRARQMAAQCEDLIMKVGL